MRDYTNPIEENKNKLEEHIKNEFRLHQRFKVIFVLDDKDDGSTKTELTIKKYCNEKGITFLIRYYNPYDCKDDCNHIARLPACHIYLKKDNDHLRTFYPDENPVQTIQSEVSAIRDAEIEKEKFQKMWKKRLHQTLFGWVKKNYNNNNNNHTNNHTSHASHST